jgi:hypothetical protein
MKPWVVIFDVEGLALQAKCRDPSLAAPRTTSRGFMVSGYVCAGCGEWNETTVDESAGRRQRYVEDCQVCCKPNVLLVGWDAGSKEFVIEAELE